MPFITHERDKVGDFQKRVLIHVPMGYLIIISVLAHWILPIPLAWLFIRYEENEDAHTKDQAWKDYFGAIVGGIMAGFTILGLRLGGIL